MRFIPFIVCLLLIVGCSSGGGNPTSPSDSTQARVALSEPYADGTDTFVDVNVDGIDSLYQFSMRVEFDPECVELVGFEPSSDFGTDPLMVAERVRNIPSTLLDDLGNPSNALIALALSRKDISDGDIKAPNFMGRIRLRNKCTGLKPQIKILDREDFLIFRDHLRNNIRMKIAEDGSIGTRGGRS
jgi:hypothetical protein